MTVRRKSTIVLLSCLWIAAAHARADEQHVDLPPNHSVEPLMVGTGLELASGVAVDENRVVYAPNYRTLGGIGRIQADGSASLFCRLEKLAPVEGRMPFAYSLRLDTQQRMIVADAGGGRLLRIAADGKRAEVLSDRYQGARLRMVQHVAIDRAGNIYFSEDAQDSDTNKKAGGRIFRFSIRTQKTELLTKGLNRPAGLAVSPDQKKLCVAEQGTRRILCFEIEGQQLLRRRELIRFPAQKQGEFRGGDFEPQGMAFDQKGRLYVCMGKGKLINVVESPSGRLLRQYDTQGVVADCHFSDTTLYIAIESKEAVFRMQIGVEGFSYSK